MRGGSAGEVFLAFPKLGLTAFGGPLAHLGYFRNEFVQKRRWLDDEHYVHLLALCQFLPGPASSQLGFAIGLLRAGWAGALAAFVAFTLPSAMLLFALATLSDQWVGPWGQGALHGLKLVAVAVVAQGVWAMARTLTPDRPRALIAALAAGVIAIGNHAWLSLFIVAAGGVAGPFLCRGVTGQRSSTFDLRYDHRTGILLLALFVVLLSAAWAVPAEFPPLARVAGAFYQAGALVFGGGHVVLPLLKETVVATGWVSNDTFLAGYGAAQAVPGPMFTLAAFLGERLHEGKGGFLGAAISLLSIFLPGLLLVAAVLPFWRVLASGEIAARILAGVNAAVVGLLAAALYDPVWTSAVLDAKDFAIALIGFVLLSAGRTPVLLVIIGCVGAATLENVVGGFTR
jgi:chromate transporter